MKIYETPEGVERYCQMSEGYDFSEYKDLILKYLPQGSSLLEIGMGPGNDFAWLSNLYKVTGSDYSPLFIERAAERFPEDDLMILDGISLNTDRTFDALFSSKVYQHIPLETLKEVMGRQWEILNASGLIIHTFWIGGFLQDIEDMRFYYHDETELVQVIEERFDVLYQKKYTEFEEGDSLFIIGRKLNGNNV